MPENHEDWLAELRKRNVRAGDIDGTEPITAEPEPLGSHGPTTLIPATADRPRSHEDVEGTEFILPLPPYGDLDVLQIYFFSPYAFN
jgi:hypothetical protein